MTFLPSTCPSCLVKGLRLRDRSPKITFSFFTFFVMAAWTLFFCPQKTTGQEVNLIPIDPGGTNRSISLFDGSSLPANSLIRIGTFANGGTNASVPDLANFVSNWTNEASTSSFLDFLNTNFITWNSFTSTNSPWPGSGTISVPNTNTATNLVGKPMYIWVYNTSTHAAATNDGSQMLILRSWETNGLGFGFPDRDINGSFTSFNLFPSTPSGIEFPNPDPEDPLPITAYGVSVLYGHYLPGSLQFRLGGITPRVEITSALAQTNPAGSPASYQIFANNGADCFFATTNTSTNDLTVTTLPTGFSISTNTGILSVATNAAAGTYPIRLVASNSLTASVATNTLTWVLQAATLTFTTTTNLISATAGVEISPFTFVSTGTAPTYSVASGNLRGLSLSSGGVLSGIPTSVGTDVVTIQASAGGQSAATSFSLAVTAPTIAVPSGDLTGGQLVVTAGTARTSSVTKTTNFTNLTGSIFPTTTGVSFDGSSLIIATNAQPLTKGTTNVTLTLTASRDVGGTAISAQTTVPLRIVAPAPTALVGTNEFEVDVGQLFSTNIITDAGIHARLVSLNNLPPGLTYSASGLISGINSNSALPNQYTAEATFNSQALYEGGGQLTTNLIFRLRNTNPPYFANSTSRALGSTSKAFKWQLLASNFPAFYEAINLPSWLSLTTSPEGNTFLEGRPASAGIYTVQLTANSFERPGATNGILQTGHGMLILHVASSKPQNVGLSGANNLQVGIAADFDLIPGGAENSGLRLNATGLPPGLSINRTTGKVTGTPTTHGTYTTTIYLQNGRGWSTQRITLTVR